MYGADYAYANTRLQETIVYTDEGVPVHVHRVREDGSADVCPVAALANPEYRRTPLARLNVRPGRLGYINYNGSVSYVKRLPKRRDWRQGLRYNNITSSGPLSAHDIPLWNFDDMLRNRYPTFRAVLSTIDGGDAQDMAWSRQWALTRDKRILYRGVDIVGKVVDGVPLLSPEFQWLQESLQETL